MTLSFFDIALCKMKTENTPCHRFANSRSGDEAEWQREVPALFIEYHLYDEIVTKIMKKKSEIETANVLLFRFAYFDNRFLPGVIVKSGDRLNESDGTETMI